jgi:hypothetical protein
MAETDRDKAQQRRYWVEITKIERSIKKIRNGKPPHRDEAHFD